jgi:hypothetical protein
VLVGGFAAIIVGVSTYAVIKLQKSEAQDAAATFERYKLDTSKQIAEADLRAKEAELALAKFRSPRLPSSDEPGTFTDKLKPLAE